MPVHPAAKLIEERRRAMRPRMSMREAARRAHISESWWRHTVAGGFHARGQWYDSNPSEATLLDMARAVDAEAEVAELLGVSPDELPPSAEDEIRAMRSLTDAEKDELIAYWRMRRDLDTPLRKRRANGQ